nr:unnamed protein product [Callosobruchus analis]
MFPLSCVQMALQRWRAEGGNDGPCKRKEKRAGHFHYRQPTPSSVTIPVILLSRDPTLPLQGYAVGDHT